MTNKEQLLKTVSPLVCEAAVVATEDIGFSQDVREACRRNFCGRYAASWACPPAVGTPSECREELSVFPAALFFSTVHPLEDSFDLDGMEKGKRAHTQTEKEIVRLCGTAFGRVLGAQSCNLCVKCTYPTEPCRFPDLRRITVEACGISVVDLCSKTGMKYCNGENTVTYFSLVFLR